MFLPMAFLLAGAGVAGDGGARVPVLLELFTSEGCSSCPPADRLLEKLDREQNIPGAEVIVLSEHVDYWNHLGWADPFSSPVYSERQREYASRLDGQTYTPELVVDGTRGFVGSDQREAEQAIRAAARQGKVPLRVKAERMDRKAKVSIHLDGAASGTVYVAVAYDSMRSQVTRGENAGRGLSHVGVAYSIEKVGKADGKTFDFERTVNLKSGDPGRIVAFVVQNASGHVEGVAQAKI